MFILQKKKYKLLDKNIMLKQQFLQVFILKM